MTVINQSLQPISPIVGMVAYADVAANPERGGIPTHDDCTNGHQWLTINFQRRNEFPLYTLASVRFLSCMENHLDHNLRLWVITVNGQGIRDLPVRFREVGGFVDELLTGRDPFKPAGYIDYPIFRRQSWTATVVGGSSDTTPPMSSGLPHCSIRVPVMRGVISLRNRLSAPIVNRWTRQAANLVCLLYVISGAVRHPDSAGCCGAAAVRTCHQDRLFMCPTQETNDRHQRNTQQPEDPGLSRCNTRIGRDLLSPSTTALARSIRWQHSSGVAHVACLERPRLCVKHRDPA